MIDAKPQAKIPLKKSDGTTVFLTMSEFLEYKKHSAASAPTTSIPHFDDQEVREKSPPKKLEPGKIEEIDMVSPLPAPSPQGFAPKSTPSSLPVAVSSHTELSTTTPVPDFFLDEAKAQAQVKKGDVTAPAPASKAWKPEDHSSLLEDDALSTPVRTFSTPDPATALLATIKEQFPIPLDKDIVARFDSLVLSRIKDVRSEIDFEQYVKKSKNEGGLGFDEDQSQLLLAVIAAAQKIMASPQKNSTVKSSRPSEISIPAPEISLDAKESVSTKAPTPIVVTPVMSTPVMKKVSAFPLPQDDYAFVPQAKNESASRHSKPIMQDVTLPQREKKTLGPVDEIHIFSLIDFRRLSPKVESSREILKGKFQSLKEESYVLFLDARDAWHESPLFLAYEQIVLSALEKKLPLETVIAQNPEGPSSEEVKALVEINHYLG